MTPPPGRAAGVGAPRATRGRPASSALVVDDLLRFLGGRRPWYELTPDTAAGRGPVAGAGGERR